ncbi:hypothetical protein HDU86_006200 [Geranomyces michiganensis]|nr:hypothetical protein HDU86_006200 [Geranomyces michiganensis]
MPSVIAAAGADDAGSLFASSSSSSCRPPQSALSVVCSGPISDALLAYIVRTSQSVIVCAPPTQAPISSSSASSALPDLAQFLHDLVRRSAPVVTPSVLLLAASYLSRLERKLPPTARGLACTMHRILLAALLIAAKYLHDGPVRNRTWAANSRLFSLPEVNLMERQLLFLLDFELATDEGVLAALVDAMPELVATTTTTITTNITAATTSSAAAAAATAAPKMTTTVTAAFVERETLAVQSDAAETLECVAQAAELPATTTTALAGPPYQARLDSAPSRQVHNQYNLRHYGRYHVHQHLHHHGHHHNHAPNNHPHHHRLQCTAPPPAPLPTIAPNSTLDPATIAAVRLTVAAAQKVALLSTSASTAAAVASSAAAAASASAASSSVAVAAVAAAAAHQQQLHHQQQQQQQQQGYPQPVY